MKHNNLSSAGFITGRMPASYKRYFAVFAVILLVASSLLLIFLPEDIMTEGANSHTITYHSGFTAVGDAGEKTVGVKYYGIAATEYNPEFWSDSLEDLDDLGDLTGLTDNWNGPVVNGSIELSISEFIVIQEYEMKLISVENETCYMRWIDGSGEEWETGYDVGIDGSYGDKVFKIVLDESLSGATIQGLYQSNTKPISSVYNMAEDRFHLVEGATSKFKISYTISNGTVLGTYSQLNSTDMFYKLYGENEGKFVRFGLEFKIILPEERSITISDGSLKKVFAGWSKLNPAEYPVDESNYETFVTTSNYVYPGDVVPEGVRDLYAIWLLPDIEVGTVSLAVNNSYDSNNKQIVTTLGISDVVLKSSIQPYIDITSLNSVSSNTGEAYTYSSFDGEHTVYHYAKGISSGAKSMYTTIYKLNNSNGYAELSSQQYLPSGTYRSANIASPFTIRMKSNFRASGDIIIDNLNFDMAAYNSNQRLGVNETYAINANYNRLIMGTNIGIDLERLKTYGTGDSYIHLLRAPYVMGGNGDSSKCIQSGKEIVSATKDGSSQTSLGALTANIGTFVIVHSGIYCHLSGGPPTGTMKSDSCQLSTYIVVKNATAMGIVSGSAGTGVVNNSANNSAYLKLGALQGGTFVYCCGVKTTGDRYEDLATEFNEGGIHDLYQVDESSVVQGGGKSGKIYGSTHLFVSGRSSLFDVQAGGRDTDSYCTHTYLEISGEAIVRHIACGTITDGSNKNDHTQNVDGVDIHVLQNPTIATLLGAGYDTWNVNQKSTMKSGNINIDISGGTIGYVYGGGMRGSVGNPGKTNVDITITMTGGRIMYDLFGGGRGGMDKIHHNAKVANNGLPDGDAGRWDKSGKAGCLGSKNTTGYSRVYGDVIINLSGTAVINGSVYGGGESMPAISSYMGVESGVYTFENASQDVATVTGNVTINIDHATVRGNIYGTGKGIELQGGVVQSNLVSVSTVYNFDNSGNPDDGYYDYTIFSDKGLEKIPYCSALIIYNKKVYKTEESTTVSDGFRFIPWLFSNNVSSSKIVDGVGQITYKSSSNYENYAMTTGTVGVDIENSTITHSVYGGGQMGKTSGNITLSITDSTIGSDVFGGGVGTSGVMCVQGSRTVNIHNAAIGGNLFGGSRNGNDGDNTPSKSYNAYINMYEGSVNSIYGGGYMGITYGKTFISVGFNTGPSDENEEWENPTITIRDSIYGGGDVGTGTSEPYTVPLVMKGSSIGIRASYTDISIKGAILGDGNSCLTEGDKIIEIESLDNRYQDESGNIDVDKRGTMTGIHRFTEATLISSVLDIDGREFDIGGVTKKYSLTHVKRLILENSTTLMLGCPVEDIQKYDSWNKDNEPTTPTSPQNKIIFTAGSTLLIRILDEETDVLREYGKVSGYTVISVADNAPYGGYVLGNRLSEGGFVIVQNGTYKVADKSAFSNDIMCWFVSGVQNLSYTMTLTRDGESLITNEIPVDVSKLKTSSTVRYAGGTFVSYLEGYGFDDVPTTDHKTFTLQLGDYTLASIGEGNYVIVNDYVNSFVFDGTPTADEAKIKSDGDVSSASSNFILFTIKADTEAAASSFNTISTEYAKGFDSITGISKGTLTNVAAYRHTIFQVGEGEVKDINPYQFRIVGYKNGVLFQAEYRMSTEFTDYDVQHLVDAIATHIGDKTNAQTIAESFKDDVNGYEGVFKTYEFSGYKKPVTFTEQAINPVSLSTYLKNSGQMNKILDNDYAGPSTLYLKFMGYPTDTTTYIGYVILYLQEVVPINEQTSGLKDDVMVTNKIEIRVDLFIKGSDVATEYDYNMNVVNGEGSVETILPENLTDYSLYLLSLKSDLPGGVKEDLTFKPVLNHGNNTGWGSMEGNITKKEFNPTYESDPDPSKYELQKLGVLSGAYMATLRISVSDYDLDSGTFTAYLVLKDAGDNFIVDTGGHIVTIKLVITVNKKDVVTLTFYDYKHGINENTGGVQLTFDYGSTITEAQCAPVMENFLGWYLTSNYTIAFNFSTPLTRDMDLYARYTYVVTFDYQDGTTSELYVADEVSGTLISKPVDPTRTGFTFEGWYKQSKCIEPWDFATEKVQGNTTLYAKWIGEEVFVLFNYTIGDVEYTLDYNKQVGDVYTLPVVHYGSTFNVLDVDASTMYDNINILEEAQILLQEELEKRGIDLSFIRWEVQYDEHTIIPIYEDTILDDTIFDIEHAQKHETYNMKYIELSALTSTIAIMITMDAHTQDVSAVVEAPSTFLVYPEVDEVDPNIYYFSYILKNATRTGHYLLYWVDPATSEETKDLPSPGLTRTIKLVTEQHDGHTYVMKGYLEREDEWLLVIEFDTYTSENKLDDPANPYTISYQAEWGFIDYSVIINNTAHGYVDAYLIETDKETGNVTEKYGQSFTAHYGDRIKLVFTPSGKYQFYRWSYQGECEIDDLDSSSTFLIVTGDSVIRVSDIGERAVNVHLNLNNKPNNDEIDTVYLRSGDVESYTYNELSKSADPDNAIYTGYAFTGEYVVCLKSSDKYYPIGVADVDVGDNIFWFDAYGIKIEITDGSSPVTGLDYTRYIGRSTSSSDPLVGSITIPAGYCYGKQSEPPGSPEPLRLGFYNNLTFETLDTLGYNLDGVTTDTPLYFPVDLEAWKGEMVIKGKVAPITYEVTFWIGTGTGTGKEKFDWNTTGVDPSTFYTELGGNYYDFNDTLTSIPALTAFEKTSGSLSSYSIIHWYANKDDAGGTFSTVVDEDTKLDAAFFREISGGIGDKSITLYAWITKNSSVNATVNLHREVLGQDDDTRIINDPWISEYDDGVDQGYTLRVTIPSGFDISGHVYDSYSFTPAEHGTIKEITREGDDLMIVVITNDTLFTLDVNYDLKTVDIKLHLDYDPVTIDGWIRDGSSTTGDYIFKKTDQKFGSTVTLPDLEKSRYTFDGFYDAKEEGSKVSSPITVNSLQDINLYARFNPMYTYTLTLLTQISQFENEQQRYTITVAEGEEVPHIEPVHPIPHYTFVGYDGQYPYSLDSDMTLKANWTVDKQEFIVDITELADTKKHISISGTSDSSEMTFTDGEINTMITYGSEIILTIRPDYNYDLDLDNFAFMIKKDGEYVRVDNIDGTTVDDIEELGNGSYRLSLFLNQDIKIVVKAKVSTLDVKYYVNNALVYTQHAGKYDDVTLPTYGTGVGQINVPGYKKATEWFTKYDDPSTVYESSTYKVIEEKSFYMKATPIKYYVWYHLPEDELTFDQVKTNITNYEAGTTDLNVYIQEFTYDSYGILNSYSSDVKYNKEHSIRLGWTTTSTGELRYLPEHYVESLLVIDEDFDPDNLEDRIIQLYPYYVKIDDAGPYGDDKTAYGSYIYNGSGFGMEIVKDTSASPVIEIWYSERTITNTNYREDGQTDPLLYTDWNSSSYTVHYYGWVRLVDDKGEPIDEKSIISPGTFNISIAKREITVQSGTASKTYDGQPLEDDDVYVWKGHVTAETEGKVAWTETWDSSMYQFSYKNRSTYEISDNPPVTNGTYDNMVSVVFTGSQYKANNYDISYIYGILTINEAVAEIVIPSTSRQMTYGGESISLGASIKDGVTGYHLGYSTDSPLINVTATDSGTVSLTNIGIGEATVFVNLIRDVDPVITKHVEVQITITKKTLEFTTTLGTLYKEYDGGYSLSDAQTITYPTVQALYEAGKILEKDKNNIAITVKDSHYNAETGKDAGSGKKITVTYELTGSSAGFYTIPQAVINDAFIDRCVITITSATESRPFNNLPLSNSNYTVNGSDPEIDEDGYTTTGFAPGEGARITISGSITNAGSIDNEIAYTLRGNTSSSNYNITSVKGTLTVTVRALSAITDNQSLDYSGGMVSFTVPVANDGFYQRYAEERGGQGDRTPAVSAKNPGGYYTIITLNYNDAGTNVTWSDGTTTEKIIRWSVGRIPLDLDAFVLTEDSVEYDAERHTVVFDNDYTLGTDYTVTYMDVSTSSDDMTNVGAKKITVTGINNYSGTKELDFTITKRVIVLSELKRVVVDETVHFEQTLIYNGSAQNVTFELDPVAVSDGITIAITGDDHTYVGSNFVSRLSMSGAKADNYDFSDYTGRDVIWSIGKRTVYIIANSAWKMYDGTPLTLENEVDDDKKFKTIGIIDADRTYFTINVSGHPTDKGIHVNEIVYSITNDTISGCYDVQTMNGSLIISNSAYDISWLSTEVIVQ